LNEIAKLSPKSVQQAVIKKTVQHPVSVYPAAISVLGGATALAFGLNVFSVAALVGGAAVTVFGGLGNYFFKKNDYTNSYINSIRSSIQSDRAKLLSGLEGELASVFQERGIQQMSLFKEKYENLIAILDKKLDRSELTYMRYITMAEQVYLAGIDNLESTYLALKSISAIDVKTISKELSLALEDGKDDLVATLNERLELYKSQQNRAKSLIEQNEQALTQLDHVTTKIANIKTEQGHAVMDIEQAMSELGSLINRTNKYSK